MTVDERWAWHTDVYAFRRVFLDAYEETSPCDIEGRWFNREAVDLAERRKRIKLRAK
jgi:CMP-2-keto-3-deoxyoctulosonic acid synthetase